MKVVVSVPGKVILLGEHAVIYGKPALITTIDKRLKVTLSESKKFLIVAPEGENYIRHIVGVVCQRYGVKKIPKVKIEITTEIPIGYHLGSSAAVAAGAVGAFSYYLKKIWNPNTINNLACECEKMIHVNSSGVDPAAVVSGGLIWYRRELDFLRSTWQLQFRIPENLNHFYLIDTGRPKETTGEMVAFVKTQYIQNKLRYGKLFDELEIQVKRIAISLKENSEKELIESIKIGEKILERLGVVSRKILPFIRKVEESGGAAKILGGGGQQAGVGYLLCYHADNSKLNQISKIFGFSVEPVILDTAGIRLEQK
jgi:mevalonate kinase